MKWRRDIEVLTPLFNRGAYQNAPEIRVPSIRGMVRWWFRALGNSADDEKEAFGGMKMFGQRLKDQVNASRLVFRVDQLRARPAPKREIPTLPHKHGKQASPQAAFEPGARFELEVFSRFGPLRHDLQARVEAALEVWLLLGALGLRANRGGGNVWPADGTAPATPSELRQRLDRFGCKWPVFLAGRDVGNTLEALRQAATDTVNRMPDVFGRAVGGREASKVKFKIVRLDTQLRLLITAPQMDILDRARAALHGHRSQPETWQML